MAIIKKKQLNEMKNNDLDKRLVEFRLELAKEKAQIAIGGTPKSSGRVREIRRTIAKILTKKGGK